MHRLEILGILIPVAFLVLYHYLVRGLAHDLFHSTWGLALLIVLLSLAIAVFSRVIFQAIASLQRNVEELSRAVGRQNAQLKALNEANLALAQETLLSTVLQRVVDLSRELARARYAALAVAGESGELKNFLTSGIDQRTRELIGELPQGEGLLGLMLTRSEPLRTDDLASHPSSSGFPPGHPDMKTFLGMPIRYKGRSLGSLYLTDKDGAMSFSDEDEEVVQLFANQAAVAIENARLYEQVQAAAVETERTRISWEMHDGLAQVLGYVNTKAQAVEAFLRRGQTQEAEQQVKELSEAAREVYQDIREGILALRSQTEPAGDLRKVLEEYIEEYEARLGSPVQIYWRLSQEGLELSPLQEVQVLRIVQEALTNVRKHAGATQVNVEFSEKEGGLEVAVTDNGSGFDPLAIERGEWPHFGLQTMQERAEAIGGAIEIDSAPGRGTVVKVRLPLLLAGRATGGVA